MKSRQVVTIPMRHKPIIALGKLMYRFLPSERVTRLMTRQVEKAAPEFFAGFAPTEQDIFVATLARSGTHWMIQIALQTIYRGRAEYDYMYDVISWPDFFAGAAVPLDDRSNLSPTGHRVIKTHLRAEHVPYTPDAKYICVIRDPKEYFVSTYYFIPEAWAYLRYRQTSVPVWLDLFLSNDLPFGSWAEHTAGWWALRHKPNVHVLLFNELKADRVRQTGRVIDFIGVDLSAEERDQVLEKSSFAYMSRRNHTFSPRVEGAPVVEIVRKGDTGGGKELLDAAQRAQVDAFCKAELQRLGSDFPYDEAFGS